MDFSPATPGHKGFEPTALGHKDFSPDAHRHKYFEFIAPGHKDFEPAATGLDLDLAKVAPIDMNTRVSTTRGHLARK